MAEFKIQKTGDAAEPLVIGDAAGAKAKTDELLRSGHQVYVEVDGGTKKVTGFDEADGGAFLYNEQATVKVPMANAKITAVPPTSGGSSVQPSRGMFPV